MAIDFLDANINIAKEFHEYYLDEINNFNIRHNSIYEIDWIENKEMTPIELRLFYFIHNKLFFAWLKNEIIELGSDKSQFCEVSIEAFKELLLPSLYIKINSNILSINGYKDDCWIRIKPQYEIEIENKYYRIDFIFSLFK